MSKSARRPPNRTEAATRERIVAAARELFAERGYAAASLAQIAKRAGVLAGSIYWAFPTKEKLFAEALMVAAEEWRRNFSPAANDDGGSAASLPGDLQAFADSFAQGPEFLRLMMIVVSERSDGNPDIRAAALTVRRMWRDAVEGAWLRELGGYEPAAAAALVGRMSRLLLQLLDGVFLALQIERDEVSATALLREAGGIWQREFQLGVAELRPRKSQTIDARTDRT